MHTSNLPRRSDAVLGLVLLFATSATVAPVTGCSPTTPHGSASLATTADAGASAGKAALVDAATEAARLTTALEGDASAGRDGPAQALGGASGCAPIGGAVGMDGGAAATPPGDSGAGDVGRDVGVTPPATTIDSGRIDAVGSGASGGAGAASGPMGGGTGGSGGVTGGGGTGGHGDGGGANQGIGGGDAAGGGGSVVGGGGTGGGGTGGQDQAAPAPAVGDLAITELLINPAGTDTGREWIEIFNRTTHTLDLSGVNISDAANEATVNFGATTPNATLLPAGGRAILIQSGDPTKNGGLAIGDGATPGGSFGTLVSLNNDADTISICSGSCSTGAVIDSVSWDATLGTGYDGHALVIDDAGRRCPATLPFGDAGSFGTPGVANGQCP